MAWWGQRLGGERSPGSLTIRGVHSFSGSWTLGFQPRDFSPGISAPGFQPRDFSPGISAPGVSGVHPRISAPGFQPRDFSPGNFSPGISISAPGFPCCWDFSPGISSVDCGLISAPGSGFSPGISYPPWAAFSPERKEVGSWRLGGFPRIISDSTRENRLRVRPVPPRVFSPLVLRISRASAGRGFLRYSRGGPGVVDGPHSPGISDPGNFSPGNFSPGNLSAPEFQPREFQPREFQPREFQPREFQPRKSRRPEEKCFMYTRGIIEKKISIFSKQATWLLG